jgi:acyl carrier protein
VLELVLFIEETFGVTVPDYEITPDNFDSVNKLANFVRNKLAIAA